MEVLRHLVSGDKYRLKEGNLDLDLTYISPTIIAMVGLTLCGSRANCAFTSQGLPGQSIDKLWRNDVDDVGFSSRQLLGMCSAACVGCQLPEHQAWFALSGDQPERREVRLRKILRRREGLLLPGPQVRSS
jgi:hypothetical protein